MNLKTAIYPKFFNPERIGGTLKEVSSDILRVESRDVVGRWFHSPDEIDLFIWVDDTKRIVKQQLTFFGQVVEWNIIEGTKTGVIIEEELPPDSSGRPVKASEVIRFDNKTQTQPLGLAMDLIQHVAALTIPEQKEIIANFFRGQKYSSNDDAEFLRRYSHWVSVPVTWQGRLLEQVRLFFRWLINFF